MNSIYNRHMITQETTLHGTFLNIFGIGTLITGKPGIGKSELALSLLDRGHQLIADDAPLFVNSTTTKIIGKNPLSKHVIFIRGIGIIDIPPVFGPTSIRQSYELQLMIRLQPSKLGESQYHVEGKQTIKDILGCLIPSITIPMIKSRNLEVLVETIVKRHWLEINREHLPMPNFEEQLNKQVDQ